MEKKERLIKELKEEMDRMSEVDYFGEKTDFKGYDLVMQYLATGEYDPILVEDHDLLCSAVNDLETLYAGYGVS